MMMLSSPYPTTNLLGFVLAVVHVLSLVPGKTNGFLLPRRSSSLLLSERRPGGRASTTIRKILMPWRLLSNECECKCDEKERESELTNRERSPMHPQHRHWQGGQEWHIQQERGPVEENGSKARRGADDGEELKAAAAANNRPTSNEILQQWKVQEPIMKTGMTDDGSVTRGHRLEIIAFGIGSAAILATGSWGLYQLVSANYYIFHTLQAMMFVGYLVDYIEPFFHQLRNVWKNFSLASARQQ